MRAIVTKAPQRFPTVRAAEQAWSRDRRWRAQPRPGTGYAEEHHEAGWVTEMAPMNRYAIVIEGVGSNDSPFVPEPTSTVATVESP